MNCHNGPLFTDNSFHNNGFANKDPGLYNVTHRDSDSGRMKTPSLRDVLNTGPWMHDGKLKDLETIISTYNEAKPVNGRDPLIHKLGLTKSERVDLLAFLKSISATPRDFEKPILPE
jgi:cytochrome c peroxidase